MGRRINFLFIHKIIPGQFKHLIEALSLSSRHRLVAIGQEFGPGFHANSIPACEVKLYRPEQPVNPNHPYVDRMASDAYNGQAVANLLQKLRQEGFVPDVIIAHSGWGEALYCKDVFPLTPLIIYSEFYYHSEGTDGDFFPGTGLSLDERCRIRSLNATQLLSLTACDASVSPTRWQKQLYPREFQGKIHTIHEGVDTEEFKSDRTTTYPLPNAGSLDNTCEIVTYVSRNLEPYRGFSQFMQAIEKLQRNRPQLRVLIAGGDEVSYSRMLQGGNLYREKICAELNLDMSRIHFLGWVPYAEYGRLLKLSSAHVYLTAPFVLSWSVIEAMSCGCVVVASDTLPVREVIRHGRNGLLCDFFSPTQIADALNMVLDHPTRMKHLGDQARQDVIENFNVRNQVSRFARLIENLTGERIEV